MNDDMAESLLEAIVTLPFYLPVDVSCLGEAIDENIGSISVEVVMPGFAAVGDDPPVVSAPNVQTVESGINWERYLNDPYGWGVVRSWKRDEAGELADVTALISHVLIRSRLMRQGREALGDAREIGEYLNERAESWSAAIGDWFEVANASFLRRSAKKGEYISLGDSKMWFFDGSEVTPISHPVRVHPPVMSIPVADIECLRQILGACGREQLPPEEHLLLRDAREALSENQTRRAVLDAATAAEISLAALLDKEIASLPAALRQFAQEEYRSIGAFARVLRRIFGVNLRRDIDGGLANIRNRAIHGGFKPSTVEATAVSNAQCISSVH